MNEREFLAGLANGDQKALQWLIGAYFPILCKFAEQFLSDSSLAKDVVQETFIKLWQTRPPFHSINSFKGYLYIAIRNGCLNLNRGRARRENHHQTMCAGEPEAVDPLETGIVQFEAISLIYDIVRSLSSDKQEIFFMSYKEGLSVKEISARLNMKLKTVKNHKYRTLLELRRQLGSEHGPLLVVLALFFNGMS